MAGGTVARPAVCGVAATDLEAAHTGDSPHVSESDACGADLVADGRHQCAAFVTSGDRAGLGVGLCSSVEAVLLDRYRDGACGLLGDRTGCLDLYCGTCDTGGMEASVVGGLALGRATDGLCLVVAAMALATGDDGLELLSHTVAVSPVEWLQ